MIFELLFVALVLVTCILLLTVVVQFIRSRRSAALRLLKGLGLGWAGYLLVVVAVAVAGAARPQRVYQRGQERCFDEMCFAVADVKTATELAGVRPRGVFYVVMVRGTSRSLGRTQKEGGLRALLWSDGRSCAIAGTASACKAKRNASNAKSEITMTVISDSTSSPSRFGSSRAGFSQRRR